MESVHALTALGRARVGRGVRSGVSRRVGHGPAGQQGAHDPSEELGHRSAPTHDNGTRGDRLGVPLMVLSRIRKMNEPLTAPRAARASAGEQAWIDGRATGSARFSGTR